MRVHLLLEELRNRRIGTAMNAQERYPNAGLMFRQGYAAAEGSVRALLYQLASTGREINQKCTEADKDYWRGYLALVEETINGLPPELGVPHVE